MTQLQKFKDYIAEGPGELSGSGKSLTRQLDLMQENKVSGSGSDQDREPFLTIDDLVERAQELFAGLKRLSEIKYPLDIRRGIRKEVENSMVQNERSVTVKARSKTYFFDIKETRDGKSYLIITESRFKGEGGDRERSNIVIFPENAREFAEAVSKMVGRIA
jgi:hypothetical protein